MGKGNRARIQRAQDKLDNPQNYVQKKQTPKWVTSAVLILIVAILVVSLVLNGLYTSGTLMRGTTALQSENYTVSGTMLSYFFHSQYSAFVTQYSSLISYIGLDTSISLKAQACTMLEDGGTWFDYFMESTTSYVGELLLCCEYAKANGLTLGEEDETEIDEAINEMAEYAAQTGYSLKSYIQAMYGSGVKESDVREAMELILLSNKAAVHANDGFEAALTEEEIQTYFNENPASFLMADYLVQSYETTMPTYSESDYNSLDEYNSAVAAAEVIYKEEKAELLAKAKEYEKLTSVKAFLDKLDADFTADYDGYYDDDETLTEAEREAKEKNAVVVALEAANVDGYAYQDPAAEDSDELAKWLFAEGRKVGDTFVLEDEDETAGTYDVYVYCVTAPAYREEYASANVAYALYSAAEAAAVTDADALKNKLVSEGVVTAEAFEAIAKEQDLSMATTVENMTKGSFGYDEADEFIFAEDRKAGDCEVLELGTDYRAVMLYLGEGDAAWYATAKNGVLNEKNTAWYESLAETYTVERNEKAMAKISA